MKIVLSYLSFSFYLAATAAASNVRGGATSKGVSSSSAAAADAPSLPDPNAASLIESQFSEDPYLNHNKMDLILSGKFALSDVHITSEHDVYGYFCDFGFDQQKEDPSLAPRYIDLYGESRHCQEHHVTFPLHQVATACREADKKQNTMHSVEPSAFIFHQPKSGSSLLANMIAASQPESTRVISDSSALSAILTCQKCDQDLKKRALQDAMYLLGRTTKNDQQENQLEHLYITLAPSNTIGISVVREAYPDTKWAFVYRSANVILQKLMNSKTHRRSCGTKKRRNPGLAMTNYLESQKKKMTALETEEQVCAAFLATNMAAAVDELAKEESSTSDTTSIGRLVSFEQDLVSNEGIQDLLEYLEVSSSPDWNRIEDQRKKRANTGQGQVWEGEVELQLSHEVKSATAEFKLL